MLAKRNTLLRPIAERNSTRLRRGAAAWLATALVLLGCGWLFAGGVTRLLIPELNLFPYLPNYPAFGDAVVLVHVILSALLAACQLVAVMRRSVVCSFAMGGLLTVLGILGIACLVILLLLPFQHNDGDEDSIVPFLTVVAACLFVGLIMLRWGWKLATGARLA
jgi:hypothetical protein